MLIALGLKGLTLNNSAIKRLTLGDLVAKKERNSVRIVCLRPYKDIHNTDVTLTGTNGLKTDTFSHNKKLVLYILKVIEFIFS